MKADDEQKGHWPRQAWINKEWIKYSVWVLFHENPKCTHSTNSTVMRINRYISLLLWTHPTIFHKITFILADSCRKSPSWIQPIKTLSSWNHANSTRKENANHSHFASDLKISIGRHPVFVFVLLMNGLRGTQSRQGVYLRIYDVPLRENQPKDKCWADMQETFKDRWPQSRSLN